MRFAIDAPIIPHLRCFCKYALRPGGRCCGGRHYRNNRRGGLRRRRGAGGCAVSAHGPAAALHQRPLWSVQRRAICSIARFSSRETFRRAYCKRLALRNRFQLTEAKFDDDLFVFGQFHALDEADQKLPAGVGRIQKLLHQLSCSVFCADRAFFL